MRSNHKVGLVAEEGSHAHQWPVKSSMHCAEKKEVQSGMTGSKRSWGGEESPVSVIGQVESHPSSGSTSMEHPVFTPLSQLHLSNKHQYSLSNHQPNPNYHNLQLAESESASDYAGLLSATVQQAFGKSHELQTQVVKTWPTSGTNKRMEWLNLQEDPPFNARGKLSQVYQYSLQSRTSAQYASSSDEEDLSINYSDRQEDEDSVIDFFPSANRPSSVRQSRRCSNGRMNENIVQAQGESRRGSLMKRRSSCTARARQPENDDESAEGRVSTSYKWDDAERWLTSPKTSTTSPPPTLYAPAKAAHCPQLLQVQARKPLSVPTYTQDKHVPEGRASWGSHVAMREAGTEFGKARKRDIATQSTPVEWSRGDSPEPEPESPILITTHEKPGGPDYSTGPDKAQKTSPPRHNTPARRSVSCSKQLGNRHALECVPAAHGKLNLLELESCHLDKLKLARDLPLGTSSTWQLFAEDESSEKPCYRPTYEPQQIKVNMLEARVSAWEDVERAKHIAKFKREQAKIEAWESLQRAEADAELRKLEVKLEKMKFEGREKIIGRLGVAQRRAQEMRGVAEAQKVEHLTRVAMRANHIRKSGHLPSSTFNVMCSLTTKIKPTSNLSFS